MSHPSHQMQFTSLLNYFPEHDKEQFNQKFRQKVQGDIILLLQEYKNLTDREMAGFLGYEDPNKIRPRRNELAKEKHTKQGVKIRDAILVEDCKRICMVSRKLSIAWKLSEENLLVYMRQ